MPQEKEFVETVLQDIYVLLELLLTLLVLVQLVIIVQRNHQLQLPALLDLTTQ